MHLCECGGASVQNQWATGGCLLHSGRHHVLPIMSNIFHAAESQLGSRLIMVATGQFRMYERNPVLRWAFLNALV